MTDPDSLSLERFQGLAETYGGCLARWPEDVREQARRCARDPAFAAILANEAALDEALDLWTVPGPSLGLASGIAARARTRRPRNRSVSWWPGVGVAAALAGAGVGAVAADVLAPAQVVSSDFSTAFGDIGSQET